MLLHQRANKINMRVTTSQFEISGKNHISQNVFLPSIIYPSLPRKRFQGSSSFISRLVGRDEKRAPLKTPTWEAKSTRQRKRKNIGTSSFLARGKSRMLSTDPLFTLFYFLKVLLRRKFLFLFPSFFNINLLFMFKIIQIAKNWSDTCVRGLEISH